MALQPVATSNSFRKIKIGGSVVLADATSDTLNLVPGFGITLTPDPATDSITITNTGNGTGAYTEITDTNANNTYYPLFSRPFDINDINPLDTPPSYQLDTIYVDNTTNPMTYNPSTGLLTCVGFSGNLTGAVSGNATSASNLTGGNNTTELGSIPYQSDANTTSLLSPNTSITRKFLRQVGDSVNGSAPAWDTVTASDVGLGNVTNESKATMFSDPTFSGHPTIEGQTLTGATGTGNLVLSNSPSLTTPTLGSASATSINKVAITTPANGSTLTILDGKTFTVNKSITLDGADSTTITLPSSTGTVALDNQQFYIGTTQLAINQATGTVTSLAVDISGNAATVTNGFYTTSSFNLGTTSIAVNRVSGAQSLTGISIDGSAGSASKAGNLIGGNNTTQLGSVPYQSGTDATTLLPPNTTTTKQFLSQTGDGTNGAAPAWNSISTADVPNFNLGTTSITFNRASAAQSLTGVSIDGSAGTVTNATSVVLVNPTSPWTIPTGVTKIKVTVVGGGGNGGGNATSRGSGGGGGGVAIKWLTGLTPGNTLTINVGAIGANSSVSSGTQTITTIQGSAGAAGTTTAYAATSTAGGAGGSASGGDININGQQGGYSYGTSTTVATNYSGSGANGPFGLGGPATAIVATAGIAATGYGAGGGGSLGSTSQGAGTPGLVIIEY